MLDIKSITRKNGRLFLVFIFSARVSFGCTDYGNVEALAEFHFAQSIDILFVIENGGTMSAEQQQLGESFAYFEPALENRFNGDYHIGVVTIGMESVGCPPCDPPFIPGSCMNETGEGGRLQDRIGSNLGTDRDPRYEVRRDENCRIVTKSNKECFYDPEEEEGIVMVGINGCGYERGLSAMRTALGELADTYNAGFVRDDAVLAVVFLVNEDDCGEVGDVSENIGSVMGNICYFAAKGVGPDGETRHPDDPHGKLYGLTPVADYHSFLRELKGGRAGMVKVAAIAGVTDVSDPAGTAIEYQWRTDIPSPRWDIVNACTYDECDEENFWCSAWPGTRYIALAGMFGFGFNGFVDSICQMDYSDAMSRLGDFLYCPGEFHLTREIRNPSTVELEINGTVIPRHSWAHVPPDEHAPNGRIVFAENFDPCSLAVDGLLRIVERY